MGWRFFIDRGGTFTDVVARAPDGSLSVRKLLSESDRYADAARHAMGCLPVEELRMGTTVATNALLERAGERVLLLITAGFADLQQIGTQQRPELFELPITKPSPLATEVRELHERIRADGTVERRPERDEIAAALEGHDCVAVVLMNALVDPTHELLVGEVAREMGLSHVGLSHLVSPETGLLARADTTVADAYLTPVLRRYVDSVRVPGAICRFMQSSGGLADAAHVTGRDAVLSGPAGGVVAVAEVARQCGWDAVIGLDMGGTSTDVCRCAGEPDRVYETEIDGVRLRAPMLEVVTVAAGGGSLLAETDGRYTVGPRSAGADPGPAAYGRGGPATVTDANVVLGRVLPDHFPHLTLDAEAARTRLAALATRDQSIEQTAEAFVGIANENMAAAIRTIATSRGYDVRDHVLCAFGGAAGQHACGVASALGIPRVVIHPMAGVFSAYGMGLADLVHHEVVALSPPRHVNGAAPPRAELPFPVDAALRALHDQGVPDPVLSLSLDVRHVGTDDVLDIPWTEDWPDSFHSRHLARFGFSRPDAPIEITALRVAAVGNTEKLVEPVETTSPHRPEPDRVVLTARGEQGIHRRETLLPGARVDGPALIVEDLATTFVAAGWQATVTERRHLLLEPQGASADPGLALTEGADAASDPMGLEIMSNRFMSIADQMGEHLRRCAHSTNIKERRDFSCAVFAPDGGLVANAPHIPVHLGAMGETVTALLASQPMRDGDAWLCNDPFAGGSHLPDLTVITPVFRNGALAFVVANRGHHADIGGPVPGSMPPHSTTIHEEGVVLHNVLLCRGGHLLEDDIAQRLRIGGVRGLSERLGDLRAQVASNAAGARLLHELCDQLRSPERSGTARVHTWMQRIREHAADVMADVVATLRPGSFQDELDDGSVIRVEISRSGNRARVDFSGTSPQQPTNRNAPRAVTLAAVLYVFRCLARRPIPLNAGCLERVDVIIPEGSLLAPRHPAAVVGGNVETSQRVVDVLLAALGLAAASQGTMNNLTFGDDNFAYYETLCGGAGAGPGFHGASAVHTHMTNTRITDPEVLEQRYPVIVRRFSIRHGSGGSGRWHGGDGVVRELEFLRPLSVQVLAERQVTRPFGLDGGGAGAAGLIEITPTSVRIETPGGGGYGHPDTPRSPRRCRPA